MRFRKRIEITGGCVLLSSSVLAAGVQAATEEELQAQEQLRFEIQQLKLINQNQAQQIQAMEARLQGVEQRTDDLTSTVQTQGAGNGSQSANGEIKREAGPSQSVENVLQEEHTLFSNKWTVDASLNYTHYDRKQLVLDGFLALDAIFLGDISIDDVESDIISLDFGARYNVTDRWQLGVRVPFLSRYSTYTKNTASDDGIAQADVDTNFKLGDIELSSYYQLFQETQRWPDTVWNVRLKAPTGKDPYGIKNVENEFVDDNGTPGDDSDDIITFHTYPGELPTGSGLWALSTGFSFVKTTDPAILFANIEYTHQFAESFSDISSEAGVTQPGDVRLGDSLSYGLGMAFALNDRTSLSFAFSQRIQEEAETKLPGEGWRTVKSSDGNAATFTTGVTYALGSKSAVSTSVGIGLTPDAPDFSLTIRFPYSF